MSTDSSGTPTDADDNKIDEILTEAIQTLNEFSLYNVEQAINNLQSINSRLETIRIGKTQKMKELHDKMRAISSQMISEEHMPFINELVKLEEHMPPYLTQSEIESFFELIPTNVNDLGPNDETRKNRYEALKSFYAYLSTIKEYRDYIPLLKNDLSNETSDTFIFFQSHPSKQPDPPISATNDDFYSMTHELNRKFKIAIDNNYIIKNFLISEIVYLKLDLFFRPRHERVHYALKFVIRTIKNSSSATRLFITLNEKDKIHRHKYVICSFFLLLGLDLIRNLIIILDDKWCSKITYKNKKWILKLLWYPVKTPILMYMLDFILLTNLNPIWALIIQVLIIIVFKTLGDLYQNGAFARCRSAKTENEPAAEPISESTLEPTSESTLEPTSESTSNGIIPEL